MITNENTQDNRANELAPRKHSRVILFYYSSMRSALLYNEILASYSWIFDCVIEMPAIPYSRNTGKRNIKKIFKILFNSPGFFLMQVMLVKVYTFLSALFKNSIKDLCKKNKIEHYYFNSVDDNLISFIKERNPEWIISSTSTLLPKKFLDVPLNGVINFHEAPLPKYKGSASYFWFIVNDEKFASTTVHYVSEKLDSGPIIFKGPKVKVLQSSVFTLWFKLLLTYKSSWEFILPYLINGNKLPSEDQPKSDQKTYSFPDKESNKILRSKKIPFITFHDTKFIIDAAIRGLKI